MKAEFEAEEIELIAQRVTQLLKPILAGNGKHETDDAIYDVPALAKYLNVSSKWIYERTHLKEIPHLKVNGLLRFRKKEIDKWLNSYNVPAVTTPDRILRVAR